MTRIASFNVNGFNGRLPILLEWFGQTFCRRYPIGGHEFGSSSGICPTSLTMSAVSDRLASAPRRHQEVHQIDARNIEFVDVSNGRDR